MYKAAWVITPPPQYRSPSTSHLWPKCRNIKTTMSHKSIREVCSIPGEKWANSYTWRNEGWRSIDAQFGTQVPWSAEPWETEMDQAKKNSCLKQHGWHWAPSLFRGNTSWNGPGSIVMLIVYVNIGTYLKVNTIHFAWDFKKHICWQNLPYR